MSKNWTVVYKNWTTGMIKAGKSVIVGSLAAVCGVCCSLIKSVTVHVSILMQYYLMITEIFSV